MKNFYDLFLTRRASLWKPVGRERKERGTRSRGAVRREIGTSHGQHTRASAPGQRCARTGDAPCTDPCTAARAGRGHSPASPHWRFLLSDGRGRRKRSHCLLLTREKKWLPPRGERKGGPRTCEFGDSGDHRRTTRSILRDRQHGLPRQGSDGPCDPPAPAPRSSHFGTSAGRLGGRGCVRPAAGATFLLTSVKTGLYGRNARSTCRCVLTFRCQKYARSQSTSPTRPWGPDLPVTPRAER